MAGERCLADPRCEATGADRRADVTIDCAVAGARRHAGPSVLYCRCVAALLAENNCWYVRKDRDLLALGLEIVRIRRARGLKQLQLAERSGLHPAYIGGIEVASRNVGIAAIFKIARALTVHPADLLATIP
jgi:Helix-turn-helix